MVDDCGDCQQAYVYNFITHQVIFVDIAAEAVVGPTDLLVLPSDPQNPYWNQSCTSSPGCTDPAACNFNFLATEDDGTCGMLDDCEACQLPFCYDPVSHNYETVAESECTDIWVGLGMLSNPQFNPLWNASCSDCAGVLNGSALTDECGDCQQAYLYNFITHQVTYIEIAAEAVAGPNEIVVLPDSPQNPLWGASCASVLGCTDPLACNFDPQATEDDGTCGMLDDCEACQLPFCYDPVSHNYETVAESECTDIWVGLGMLSNPQFNPLWNASCELLGCTYEQACNYLVSANVDDGSCEWTSCTVHGCTYANADNYSSLATHDDGTCTFEGTSCDTDFDNDGAVATSDLLIFLADYGEICLD